MRPNIYKNYLLLMLTMIYAFNGVDRSALGLLLQNIKADFALTDTQLGFLTGLAFAAFYSVMGIPLARCADRGNRIAIIAITTALWSIFVSLCSITQNFFQLLLVRIGVAVGEAGCAPPAHSLIPDYFTRAERPRAAAIYMLGSPLSIVIGYFCAGWLNELYGWRMTFALLGLPGLGLAALAWLTLREPRLEKRRSAASEESPLGRGTPILMGSPSVAHPSLKEVCKTLWANKTFRHLVVYFSIGNLFGYGIMQWQPAFFVRSFGFHTGELGTWFSLIYGLGGLAGIYWGGELASRHASLNERLQLKTMAIVQAGFGLLSACAYLSASRYLSFGLMALAFIGSAATYGPTFATIQTLVPERMRATALALIYLISNLIGMGLGPLLAGALSDIFRPWAGEESLRYALLALCPGFLWVGWHAWQASRTVTGDLQAIIDPVAS